MNTATLDEIDGIIQRDRIRKRVKEYIFLHRHDLQNQLTNKVIQKCVIFISGYVKCLRYHGIQPINVPELEELLMRECIDWTISYLEEGGN